MAVIVSQKKSNVSHHIIFITAYAQNASTQTLTQLANSPLNSRATQSGSLAVDASFHFVDVRDLGMICTGS